MPEIIIYTAGITFAILLLVYLHITHNKIAEAILRYPAKHLIKRRSSIDFYLKTHALHFKTRAATKKVLVSLITTLVIAFILYNYVFFTVPVSNSMRPTFEAGDLVLMQRFDTEPHESDIIMFAIAVRGKDPIITHRVYSVTPDGVKTKGDANGAVDSWFLPPAQIYAKAITIGGQPIVIKSIGHYFLETQISSTYAREFGFMQTIIRGGKQLGLLIFVICLVAYTLLSIEEMKKYKKHRRN